VQDELLLSLGLGDTRQTNPAAFAEIEPDFDKDDLLKTVNDLGWSETSGGDAQLLVQADPETVTQESNQDVGFDTSLNPVKDWPQIQLAFERAEDGFNFGELDVLTPEFFRIVIG
jgi:hypothetical protein